MTPSIFPGIDVGIAVPDTDYFRIEGVAGEVGLFPYSIQGSGIRKRLSHDARPNGHGRQHIPQQCQESPVPGKRHVLCPALHEVRRCLCTDFGMFKGLIDINGMLYDPCGYGGEISLYDGWQHAYDRGYTLSVDGEWYGASADYSVDEAGGGSSSSCRSRSAD